MSAPPTTERPSLVAKELRVPFLLLLLCFAAWGTAANLTDVLVGVFRSIFTMTNSNRRSCNSPTTAPISCWLYQPP